jgi:chaperone BCS1
MVAISSSQAAAPSKELTLYTEPLDTPGVIPNHLKRAATAEFPLFEILQRFLFRLQPGNSGGDLEKILAIIALYRAAEPAYRHLKTFFSWAFTSQVTIPEYGAYFENNLMAFGLRSMKHENLQVFELQLDHTPHYSSRLDTTDVRLDLVARDISAWMAAHVINKSIMTRGAMIVSSNAMEQGGSINMFNQMIAQNAGAEPQSSDETQCLPPVGKRIFWCVFQTSLSSYILM